MRVATFLACFLAAMAAVQAASFDARIVPVEDQIYQDEIAIFSLTITNLLAQSDTYTVSTVDYEWLLDTDEPVGEVDPAEQRNVLLELSPKPGTPTGVHAVRIKVRGTTEGDFREFTELVTLRSLEGSNRTYVASIAVSVDAPDTIDPREGVELGIYMRNRNAREYDRLIVRAESDLFFKEYPTSLGAIGEEGEKTTQVTIPLDPYTPPGVHPLTVSLVVDGQVVSSVEGELRIVSYDKMPTQQSAQTKFFKKTSTYTVRNDGNTAKQAVITHPTTFFQRLFTSASADHEVRQTEAGRVLAFESTLQSQTEYSVSVTENYRLLAILAILVVLSIISYYVFRSPVVVHKEASVHGSHEGASKLKVRLFIKNRGAKVLHNLHVVDKMSSMAELGKEQQLGTLHPTKVVRKKGHGTLIRWDIDTLDAFEERIITYQVATQLQLVGDVYLPAAKVKFEQRGRERQTFSNEVNIPRES